MLTAEIHADALDLIVALADTGSIPEPRGKPSRLIDFFDHITGRPRYRRYDHPVLAEQSIQQTRFADVGPAANAHRSTFAKQPSPIISMLKYR